MKKSNQYCTLPGEYIVGLTYIGKKCEPWGLISINAANERDALSFASTILKPNFMQSLTVTSTPVHRYITEPKEIDSERFNEMLCVLPPSKYAVRPEWCSFHLCEYYKQNIVYWFAAYKGKFFEWLDLDRLSVDELQSKINATLKAAQDESHS